MGQKVNPHGLRVGVIKDWDSKWYADAEFSDFLVEDYNIRKFLKKKLYSAGVSKIEIERASDRVKVILYTAKPGVVIGKGGAEIEVTKKELSKLTDKKVLIDIKEIKRPDKDSGEHRAAAGKPRILQKGDEVLHRQNYESRRAGHQDRCGRTSGRCGYRAYRVLQRRNHSAADLKS